MAFFNNAGAPTEMRVGRRTVQIQRRLAEGGFGVVDLVVDAYSKQELVLKRCNIDRAESFEIARKEINMLQKYKGPYIVELLESAIFEKSRTSREALLLMEYYPGDHLLGRLLARNGSYLPQDTIYRMFGQLCLALKDMHLSRPPIVHRDIKLENVLFGTDGKVRLCDFGSCVESPVYTRNAEERQDAEEHIQKETTQMYRAPEMVDLYLRPTLTEKTDIWAMGCMLYAMCFLIHPFQDGSSLGILNAKIHFPNDSPFNPDTTHALILRMLDIDPECRPCIEELIQWVTAVASGQPLPAQVLSAEAQQCRANRIAADQIRESKANSKLAKQKAAQAKPAPKKPVQLSANSVAARRLATMRGQPLPEDDFQHDEHSSSDYYRDHPSPPQPDAQTFDPFFAPATHSPPVGAAPARASFTATPAAALFAPSSGASSFAAFGDDSTTAGSFDPFSGAPAASSAGFDAFGAAPSAGDGFSNFATHDAPAFDAFTPTAAAGFDAFEATPAAGAGASFEFAPTAPAAGFQAAGFDNFDDDAAPTAADNPFDSFAPTDNTQVGFAPSNQGTVPDLSTFDPFADDSYGAATAAVPAPVAVVDFFVTDDAPAPTPAPERAQRKASAASLLFESFVEEEPPALPAAASVFVDPPAFLAPAPLLAPTPAKPPAAPAMIDIFNDDLVSPVSSTAQGSSMPVGASGKRNPLDVLSLYDMPAPAPAPKNVMTGTGMSAAASISNIGVTVGPAGRGMQGMPGGMPGAMSGGFGGGGMGYLPGGSPAGHAGGMARGLSGTMGGSMPSVMTPGGIHGGGMMMQQGTAQGRSPMAQSMMGASPMSSPMNGTRIGGGPGSAPGGMNSGGRPAYQSGSNNARPPADPFDAINVLKK